MSRARNGDHHHHPVMPMVHLDSPNPFGIPASHDRYAASLEHLRRAGRFDCRTPQALRRATATLRRDQALQDASGRWVIGRPDPIEFVPGDIAAIRKIVGGTTILKNSLLTQIKHAWPSTGGEVALTRAASDTMLIELTTATRTSSQPPPAVPWSAATHRPRRCWTTCASPSRTCWWSSAPTWNWIPPRTPGRRASAAPAPQPRSISSTG
jgi:hypothetical protein